MVASGVGSGGARRNGSGSRRSSQLRRQSAAAREEERKEGRGPGARLIKGRAGEACGRGKARRGGVRSGYGGVGGVREQGSCREVGGDGADGLAGCWAGPVGIVLFLYKHILTHTIKNNKTK